MCKDNNDQNISSHQGYKFPGMPSFGGLQLHNMAERICDNVIQIPTTDPVHHITDSIYIFLLKLNR